MDREQRTVEVFSGNSDYGDWIPSHPAELILFIQDKMKLIPQEHMHEAFVAVEGVPQYEDSAYGRFTIGYKRMENDEEYAERKAWHDNYHREAAERERAEFERLKKKFGA